MTPKNQALFQRALEKIPWATQTNAKRHDSDGATTRPPFIQRAKGCRMWDIDDKEYIDFRSALGPITLGYQYQEVDDAVRRQMEQGVLFSMSSPIEIETSEAILDTIGWADKIRFMKTGADVNACCLRLARSYTGRDHILNSGYHGYQDWFTLDWENPGIPQSLNNYVHSIEYDD
ncbi:MAG: aminotransferase class III-fold pyridoxal phosphate-dependent enzyme, partial [Verrucomicrobiia bacterium]